MSKRRAVYTTGQAAKIRNLAPQTIIRLFKKCEINGYIVRDSNHRRIPHRSLVEFMRKGGCRTQGAKDQSAKACQSDIRLG